MPTLRWMIATLWLAVAAIGLAAGWRARALTDGGVSVVALPDLLPNLLLAPATAAACLWLIGPSLSAAVPVALLVALAAWAAAADLRAAIIPAALLGAALALSEYRAPMAVCGLVVLMTIALRRVGFRGALAPLLAYAFGAVGAVVGYEVLVAWSADASISGLGEALADRLDPARDPLDIEALPVAMVDTLATLLPGPRSVALGMGWALGFGLVFAPALARASQRVPMPVGRAYAALPALLPLVIWVAWFGGRSALGSAEGGIIYGWLTTVAVVALLHWLTVLVMSGRRLSAAPLAAA